MRAWQDIINRVLIRGVERPDRTGVGTLALFGEQAVFDNREESFPAVTAKRLAFGQVKAELACFLRGYDSLAAFNAMGCNIWDGNGQSDYWKPRQRFPGDLGRIYGVQWRDWRNGVRVVDQLTELVAGIKKDPYGRRHLVTAWNPAELDVMCLPPCHVMFQAFVRPRDGDPLASATTQTGLVVDLLVYMRSVDLFLGMPFDVASYALLQRLLCNSLGPGYESGWLTFHLGDAHIYKNHLEQARTVLSRDPRDPPWLRLKPDANLFEFHSDEAELVDYDPHPAVPAPLNV